MPVKSFTTPYEFDYQSGKLSAIKSDQLIGLPILLHCPSGAWAAITEANLTNYAGMYLKRDGDGTPAADRSIRFVSKLSPLLSDPKIAVKGTATHDSPCASS